MTGPYMGPTNGQLVQEMRRELQADLQVWHELESRMGGSDEALGAILQLRIACIESVLGMESE